MNTRHMLATAVLACAVVSTASAQYRPVYDAPVEGRYELTPIAGYMWGGSAEFSSQGTQPGGKFELGDSFMWGANLAFRSAEHSWVEILYRRQDTQLNFSENLSGTKASGDFATNYIHIGGRQEFGTSPKFKPFIRGSLGATVFDPQFADLGTSTKFSLSIGGGFTYMLKSQRVGIQGNIHGWFTFVPTNEVGIYCSPFFPYYCYAGTSSQTVSQGEASGGLVFRF